jgi:glycosyltransferase involved in cell wall biosynthesis
MKILFLCKEFPHSKVIGGPIIIYNRVKYLSKNHLVSLAAFSKEGDDRFIPSIKPFCHDLQLVPLPQKRSPLKVTGDFFFSPIPHYFLRVHDSKRMAETVAGMVKQDHYDFVIAEYSVMGQFLHNNPLLPPVRRIMSVHECYYLARLKDFRHYRTGRKKLREAINLKGLRKYEFDMYRHADKVLTLTNEGKEELLEICPDLNISIVPHGVDVESFSFSEPDKKEKSVVFLGNYLHYPNADAVLYFHREMWARLKTMVPDVKFYVVGNAPSPEIKSLSQDKNIIVTGRVADVIPYIKKGSVFICPVRLGGGFRGKILEAMSVGRPVVSTSLGSEGIPAADRKNIIIVDEPERFATGIFDLLNDESLYQEISRNARRLVEEKYAWQKGVEVLEGVLETMMKEEPKA